MRLSTTLRVRKRSDAFLCQCRDLATESKTFKLMRLHSILNETHNQSAPWATLPYIGEVLSAGSDVLQFYFYSLRPVQRVCRVHHAQSKCLRIKCHKHLHFNQLLCQRHFETKRISLVSLNSASGQRFFFLKTLLCITQQVTVQPNPSNADTPLTMSVVSLLGVQVVNNPAKFTDQYKFEITFECMEQLRNGISKS